MYFLYQQIINKDYCNILKKEDLLTLSNLEKSYKIHRVVSVKSKFIKTMLESNLKSTYNIKLDISNDSLEKLHKYFYFEKININNKNILDLLYIADYLILDILRYYIFDYLEELELEIKYFEIYYRLLEKYSFILNDEIVTKLEKFIVDNYKFYCLSEIIESRDIVLEYLNNCNLENFIMISNNLLCLKRFNNKKLIYDLGNMLKSKRDWKYLSKKNFWNLFIPFITKLKKNILTFDNLDENIKFINRFDGKIKNMNDHIKFLKISNLNEGDFLDVLDKKNIWYLSKIIKKFNNNIQIEYRGWNENFNEFINIENNIDRLSLKETKSFNFRKIPLNNFVEFKIDNRWKLFRVIENNDNFLGLKDNKSGIIKTKHNNFNLVHHPIHINRTYYYSIERNIDIKWDDIPYDIYVELVEN